MGEILTVSELAALLKMSRRQVYEMTSNRTRARQKDPLPLIRVNGNLRFSKTVVEAWLLRIQEGRVQ
jgi:excisionase family DNA binding protein